MQLGNENGKHFLVFASGNKIELSQEDYEDFNTWVEMKKQFN